MMDPAARMVLGFLGSCVRELPRYSNALTLSPNLRARHHDRMLLLQSMGDRSMERLVFGGGSDSGHDAQMIGLGMADVADRHGRSAGGGGRAPLQREREVRSGVASWGRGKGRRVGRHAHTRRT